MTQPGMMQEEISSAMGRFRGAGRRTAGISAFVLLVAALQLIGCESTARVEPMAARSVDSTDVAEVLRAAETILHRQFGQLSIDRSRGKIVTLPVEFESSRDTGAAREVVGAPSRMRRMATCFVQRQGDQIVARCRVDVERRDTDRRDVQVAVMDTNSDRLTDTPNYTAADRGAGRTGPQNEVWTHVRRDGVLERAILDELRNQFAAVDVQGASDTPKPRADGV